MKQLPTQQRALRKRQALIDAAEQEFSESGFEVATAKSIAARAGVAVGTFYQYFDNKHDILREIAEQGFAELHARIPLLDLQLADGSRDRIVSLFSETLDFVYQYHARRPELHRVLEQRRVVDADLSEIMCRGEGVLRARVLQFVQSFNTPHAEIVASNLFAMAEGLVHRHVFEPNQHNPQQVIQIGAEMLSSYFLTHYPQ
ncbi:TetR/AcrR family transcriptional regulator [Arenicella xantha]|uniref:TetR family transcriptional regulator n=1 Tax=Arenicella xantha TaxID=644221 RepID=A0A395JHD6_9GAMM|nr:TetR/AcrR family transcriptional regulator [Arenicella xantha]RBP49083.1 TetR family transcriptional regulator [Arenicella xantha]